MSSEEPTPQLPTGHDPEGRGVTGEGRLARLPALDGLRGIGLPMASVDGDVNGLRLGTPEIVRWGMTPEHMPRLASLIARALTTNDPASLAAETKAYRSEFRSLHFIRT